jgi:hypothetical protein
MLILPNNGALGAAMRLICGFNAVIFGVTYCYLIKKQTKYPLL